MQEGSEIDLDVIPKVGNYVYVIRFSSGTIKVGRSSKLRSRLRKHALSANQMGTSITRYWVSDPCVNDVYNERLLVGFCAGRARRTTGGMSGEYFEGLKFEEVRDFAASLPVGFINEKDLDAPAQVPEECKACDKVDKRVLSALSVMYQLEFGGLRLVDVDGRDVTHVWTTGMTHHCTPYPDLTFG